MRKNDNKTLYICISLLENLFHTDAEKLSYQVVCQDVSEHRLTANQASNMSNTMDSLSESQDIISLKTLRNLVLEKRDLAHSRLIAANDNDVKRVNYLADKNFEYWNNWLIQISIQKNHADNLQNIFQTHGTTL